MNSPSSPAWLAETRSEGETTYFARRAREEWRAVVAARHPAAREAHLTLAQLYEERALSVQAGIGPEGQAGTPGAAHTNG